MATILRRIDFCDVRFYGERDGVLYETDPVPAFEHVRHLPPRFGEPTRYMTLPSGDQLIMDVVDSSSDSIRGRFGLKRRTALPQVEEAGVYTILQLAALAGLAELRHFVVYPRRGVLGIEVNGNAPRLPYWIQYLMSKCPGVELVEQHAISAGTAAEALERIGRIAGTSITVYPEQADVLDDLHPGLRRGLVELRETVDDAREITVSFEVGTLERSASLEIPWRDSIAGFLRRKDGRSALESFRVRAFDPEAGRTREIDLLDDRFVGFREVLLLDRSGRVVDSDSMFGAIDSVAQDLPVRSQ